MRLVLQLLLVEGLVGHDARSIGIGEGSRSSRTDVGECSFQLGTKEVSSLHVRSGCSLRVLLKEKTIRMHHEVTDP